jgi:hypothetical protein
VRRAHDVLADEFLRARYDRGEEIGPAERPHKEW